VTDNRHSAGAEYVPGQGSVDEYLNKENSLRKAAQTAGTPEGYTKAFTNLIGSTEQIGYLTYKTLDTYSPDECAAFCNSEKYCLGFNLFFERDPSVDPGEGCSDPAPVTNIKCSIYGYPVAEASATNQGQYRGDFHVVITGSNGKLSNPAHRPEYSLLTYTQVTPRPAKESASRPLPSRASTLPPTSPLPSTLP
jgi:hypothetical protein